MSKYKHNNCKVRLEGLPLIQRISALANAGLNNLSVNDVTGITRNDNGEHAYTYADYFDQSDKTEVTLAEFFEEV